MQIRSIITSDAPISVVKTGINYLDLFGVSTYSGTTEIQQGGVDAQVPLAFGTSAVTIQPGAFMWWWGDGPGGTSITYANDFTFNGQGYNLPTDGWGAAFNVNGTNSTAIFNGTVHLNGTIIARGANDTLTLNGPVILDGPSTIAAGITGGGWDKQLNINNSIDGSAANADLTINVVDPGTRIHPVTGNITLGAGTLRKYLSGTLQLTGTANSWGSVGDLGRQSANRRWRRQQWQFISREY